jgi:hypothetical protein
MLPLIHQLLPRQKRPNIHVRRVCHLAFLPAQKPRPSFAGFGELDSRFGLSTLNAKQCWENKPDGWRSLSKDRFETLHAAGVWIV